MKVTISGYGLLKNYVGVPDKPYQYESSASKSIREIIREMNIPDGMVMLISVNDQQKNFDYIPQDGDDIKFIPPISGG
jgi:molybdopterin converting factor small subunit